MKLQWRVGLIIFRIFRVHIKNIRGHRPQKQKDKRILIMKEVEIYTDGACSGNPGKGGFGVILKYKETERELSRGYSYTTNNRMELLAVIEGLRMLKYPCKVRLYSDSKYVVDAIEKGWLKSWQSCGWKKADGKTALNVDLWSVLSQQLKIHEVEFIWVKGHSNNAYNERCDRLAVAAYEKENLIEDPGAKG